jgi:hypothetical protein
MPTQPNRSIELLEQLLTQKRSQMGDKHHEDIKNGETKTQSELRYQIVFDYYKQQREEYAHLLQERSSVTIQILFILGALVAVFLQSSSSIIKLFISFIIVLLGIVGLLLFLSINKSATAHVRVARAARKSLGFLEEFSLPQDSYGRPYVYYALIYVLIIITGILFMVTTFL